jgi:hypothetical protein
MKLRGLGAVGLTERDDGVQHHDEYRDANGNADPEGQHVQTENLMTDFGHPGGQVHLLGMAPGQGFLGPDASGDQAE